LNRRYFLSLKQYGWIIIACTLLALIAGFVFLKKEPQVYQVSSTMYVVADAPPTSTFNPSLSANDSVGLATNYASQITSRSVMQFVYQSDPQIAQHGYGPEDLLSDVVTTPSATSSTILITASAVNANDAVLMANDVAKGFQMYIQTQNQQQLNALRSNLQNQMATVEKQKSATEGAITALATTTDPHYSVYNAELNDEIHTIDSIQTQLLALPASASSNIVTIQFAATKDAVPAIKSNLILAITAGIGLLVGILIMLLFIYNDKRLQDGEQVREKLGVAYLGGISRSNEFAKNPAQIQGVVAHQIGDIGANLSLTGVLPYRRQTTEGAILLVTSAQSTEGKTTITQALAAAMARGGNTVVVVDGNLRRPATHLAFGMETTGPGLSSLLMATDKGIIDPNAVVQRSHLPGVWFLAAGMPIDDPVLLLSRKMPKILEQLSKKVDVVIIDGPAVLSGAEASVFASMADGVVWVVDARHTKLSLLMRSKEILHSLTHTPAGIIMNGIKLGRQNSYYASAYSTGATQDWMSIAVDTAKGNDSGNVQTPEPVVALSKGALMGSSLRSPSPTREIGMPPQALSVPSRPVNMTASQQ
jgi:capsular exopolysaccharide synthesis family protein